MKGSYRSNRSLGKAVNKLKKNLPCSPSKRKAVVTKLLFQELPEIGKKLYQQKKSSKCLSVETENKIKNFYLRDDISRKEPGRKDMVSVKNPETGKREPKQKCYMMMTISEAYELFVNEYPESRVKNQNSSTSIHDLCTLCLLCHIMYVYVDTMQTCTI